MNRSTVIAVITRGLGMHCIKRVIALAATFAAAASLAFAHAHPKTMSPAPDSTVSDPHRISIEFTEALEAKFSSIRLTDSKGATASNSPSQVDPADTKHMTLDLPHLTQGIYNVHWITVATDGHRLEGDYKFTVK
jgi:copper resistance protein C